MRAIPTTGMTTAIAVFAPVSKPPLPPPLLFEPLSASEAAEEEAAAASAEPVADVGSCVGSEELSPERVIVWTTVTGPVGPVVSSPSVRDGAVVTMDVINSVVGSADGAVLV